MAKRTLDDVFNDDPLGLLEVSVTKSKKLSHYAIYYETFEELKTFIREKCDADFEIDTDELDYSDGFEELDCNFYFE